MKVERNGDLIFFQDIDLAENAEDFTSFCLTRDRETIAEALTPHYETIRNIAGPAAVLKQAVVEQIQDNSTCISGEVFPGKLLADKLKVSRPVFLFAITIGRETEEHEYIERNLLKSMIKTGILYNATDTIKQYLEKYLDFKDPASLNPGSLPDWPIRYNKTLFSILGKAVSRIGITLDQKGYMYPLNSSSGIMFDHSNGYTNCSLCRIGQCPGRREPFNDAEYQRIFG